jgi:3-isopropylmalate/(R)-2-methylmalate dehydratase small subunit
LENGIDDITETMAYKDEIDAYEAKWDNIYA